MYKRYIVLLFLIILSNLSLARPIDTLHVWAESGLLIREQPNINSPVIGKLSYGDTVVVEEYVRGSEFSSEVIPEVKKDGIVRPKISLSSSYIKISYAGSKGYTFGGYLSKLPVLEIYDEGEIIVREHLSEYFSRVFGEFKREESTHPDRDIKTVKVIYNNGFIYKEIPDSYSVLFSYLLDDITLNEVYLLIQASSGFEQKAKKHHWAYPIKYNRWFEMELKISQLCTLIVKKLDGGYIHIFEGCSC